MRREDFVKGSGDIDIEKKANEEWRLREYLAEHQDFINGIIEKYFQAECALIDEFGDFSFLKIDLIIECWALIEDAKYYKV